MGASYAREVKIRYAGYYFHLEARVKGATAIIS